MKSEESRGIWKTTFWETNSSVLSAVLVFLITQSVPHLMAKVQNISDGNRGRAAGDKDRIAAGSSNHHQPLFQRRRRKKEVLPNISFNIMMYFMFWTIQLHFVAASNT